MARRSTKTRKILAIKPSSGAKGRNGRVKKSSAEKFEELCKSQINCITNSTLQVFEILEDYTKHHLLSCEPIVLRELLRSALKFLPSGIVKTKIRGILSYYTRMPISKTFMKLAQVLEIVAKTEKLTTFTTPKEIPFDRIVDQTTILRVVGRPQNNEKISIINDKVDRLKKKGPTNKINELPTTSTQSLTDSEPPYWARSNKPQNTIDSLAALFD